MLKMKASHIHNNNKIIKEKVWPPGSADKVCLRWSLMTQVYTALGQHGSDWSRDLATLTFDLGGHGACGWCGSSTFMRTPSLKKFVVCLAVRKIYSHQRWGTVLPNLGTLGLWVLELFPMYTRRTDGRTDGQKQRLLSLPYGRGRSNQYILTC